MAFAYVVIQAQILILANAVLLFWSIAFPFKYRRMKNAGKMQHIHIALVILAVILPLPPTLVHLKDGFVSTSYPTMFCSGRNINLVYYFITLPESIMIASFSVLMILTSWLILKVNVLAIIE